MTLDEAHLVGLEASDVQTATGERLAGQRGGRRRRVQNRSLDLRRRS